MASSGTQRGGSAVGTSEMQENPYVAPVEGQSDNPDKAPEGEDKKKTKIPPIVFVPLLGAFIVITVVPSVVSNLMSKSSSSPTPAPPSSTNSPSIGGSGTKGWDLTPAPAPAPPTTTPAPIVPVYGISTEYTNLYTQANITGIALSSLQNSWVAANKTTIWTNQATLYYDSTSAIDRIALDASGNMYFSDGSTSRIIERRWNATSTTFSSPDHYLTFGDTSTLKQPRGMAISSNVLYTVDSKTRLIQSLGINNATITSLISGLTNASDIVVDTAGAYLYIADTGAHCIRRVALKNATITLETWAGQCGTLGYYDGSKSASKWNSPSGLAIDIKGNIYVSDTGNHVIRKIDGTSFITSTIAGTAGVAGFRDDTAHALNGLLNSPLAITINSTLDWTTIGNNAFVLYVADSGNNYNQMATVVDDEDNGSDLEIDEMQKSFSPLNLSSYDSTAKLSRAESAEIFSKKFVERTQVKASMIEDEKTKRLQKEKRRQVNIQKWQVKLAKSPFKVNLVADNERLDEENRVRLAEESRRLKALENKTKQVKNDIILKALQETSDLEALRREKRVIIEEEKRLKALLDLEKTNSHRKMDMLAAQNAEKKRKQEKIGFRMKQRKEQLNMRDEEYKKLLKEKLALDN
ncbi:hypothetical protein THRCLA_00937 [Thraustotheca clavata]|uniref:SMP-30/Gluconolactonase/LRE-like region domain-containing protein n=1 Tax=Thraustotheca clavata TaxID=74557 RepID=A0A1W0A9Z2_9STRA|nr:hypothetical protein THRCLA_00937 [Thraustotheca clavata]